MLILAIDTSTNAGSVALFHSEKGLICEEFINIKRNHSDTIMTAIDSLFKYSQLHINDVNKIVVSVGPGSFTGIRVGVAIGKGLVFPNNKELVGINTLDLIANNVSYTDSYIMPMIDARKERAYYSLYKYTDKNTISKVEEYKDGTIGEFLQEYRDKKIIFVGDASYIYKELISDIMGENAFFIKNSNIFPRASVLAELGLYQKGTNPFLLEPYYHSKTQAEREKEERDKNYFSTIEIAK